MNLLQWLTELRKHFTYGMPNVLEKNVTQGQPDGTEVQGKAWGKDVELPCCLWGAPISPTSPMFTNLKGPKPHPLGCLWRFHHTGVVD